MSKLLDATITRTDIDFPIYSAGMCEFPVVPLSLLTPDGS